ncbi:glutathione S-transferase 1-like [Manduca sexta]|uniref:glutathione S-transferase 1-like n=1 Tax=Manduca sexta TaxID=7130 RepID=UPI0011832CB5|nr:glutathione S-transferase 1-like [Manduca sexta]
MGKPPILYKMDASPPARAVMMVANILELSIDKQDLNPVFREQDTPEFVKKNPMKTIPIYEEDTFTLADSHAIIIYLMEKYAKPYHYHLYPSHHRKRAVIHQRLFFDSGILFPRLQAVMAPTYVGRLSEMTRGMIKNIEAAYDILESYLADTIYIADDLITIADISIISTMGTLDGLLPVNEKRFPKLKRWMENMNKTYYCKKINIPGAKMHVESLLTCMELTKQKKSKL